MASFLKNNNEIREFKKQFNEVGLLDDVSKYYLRLYTKNYHNFF